MKINLNLSALNIVVAAVVGITAMNYLPTQKHHLVNESGRIISINDQVDNASMGLEEENPMEAAYGNVGSVDKVKPAETGISKYLDIVRAHDWFHHFSDDHRIWQRGQTDKDNLKALYSTLTPDEKQQAMDAFIDKYLQVYRPDQFPTAANNVKYLTTNTFKGAI